VTWANGGGVYNTGNFTFFGGEISDNAWSVCTIFMVILLCMMVKS
jgi:hypothetical protein